MVGSLKTKYDIINHFIGNFVLVMMNLMCRGMLFRRFRIPLLVFVRLHRIYFGDFTTTHNAWLAGNDGLVILGSFFESWN